MILLCEVCGQSAKWQCDICSGFFCNSHMRIKFRENQGDDVCNTCLVDVKKDQNNEA